MSRLSLLCFGLILLANAAATSAQTTIRVIPGDCLDKAKATCKKANPTNYDNYIMCQSKGEDRCATYIILLDDQIGRLNQSVEALSHRVDALEKNKK